MSIDGWGASSRHGRPGVFSTSGKGFRLLIRALKTVGILSDGNRFRLSGPLYAVLVFALVGITACRSYRPEEVFPAESVSPTKSTGRREVESYFPKPGEDPISLLGASDLEVPNRGDNGGYKPTPREIKPELSQDGTYRFLLDAGIPARDGKQLMTDVYGPAKQGKYPVILERTPLNRKSPHFSLERGPTLARAGYIYLVQNVRGLFGSEGIFFPFKHEIEDGADMVEWLTAQTWHNGAVGLIGSGYGAYAAFLAASGAPGVKAMVVDRCSSDLFLDGGYYLDGVPMISALHAEVSWRLLEYPGLLDALKWDDALFHLPLNRVDDILGLPLPFWDECLRHPSYNYYWQELSLTERYDDLDAAVLHIGSWHSLADLGGMTRNFVGMSAAEERRGRSGRQSLLMGPWSEGVNSETYLGYYDFTDSALVDEEALYRGWFDKWLKGDPEAKGAPATPVRLFVLGSNRWMDLNAWPPEKTKYEPFFPAFQRSCGSKLGFRASHRGPARRFRGKSIPSSAIHWIPSWPNSNWGRTINDPWSVARMYWSTPPLPLRRT